MVSKYLRLFKIIRGKDFFVFRDIKESTITLGNKNASWTIIPDLINKESTIYSFGAGTDISFDLALISKFNINLHVFDPTPKSIQYLKQKQLPKNFIFHEIGLASYDGTANFALPENPDHVSASIIQKPGNNDFFIGEVKRLQTIMHELKHSQIDLLKMDIEGAEYDVIDDLISSKVKVKQLLIEFHHRFPNVGISKTKDVIKKLRMNGFSVFHVSTSGEEISFLKHQA
jgi:FkbM family methyltransferase